MDKNTNFFWKSTLRICGSLDIEKALCDLFEYFRTFIPADRAILGHYDQDEQALIAIAGVDKDKGPLSSFEIPLPPNLGAFIETFDGGEAIMVSQARDHPIGGYVLKSKKIPGKSSIVLRLLIEGKPVGALIIISDMPEKFTEEHIRLASGLVRPCAIALSNSLRYREVLHLKEILAEDYKHLQDDVRRLIGDEIVGADFGLKGVMESVRQVAPLSSPVLLLGPTGVGKEVIANAIHNLSSRRDDPFVKVDCGTIPETLLDSELFGHEKGAFTGAQSRKRGRFERAHGGTLFLDEVGELSVGAQLRLLRVLQSKEIERVGGSEVIRVDIRVIAATHRDLEALLKEERFREDLYFRLKVFPISIPPLRERRMDIPALVHYFIRRKAREMRLSRVPTLAPTAMDRLMDYDWPGNVRELENAVERALILSEGRPLAFSHFRGSRRSQMSAEASAPDRGFHSLDEVVSRHIRSALRQSNGRVDGERGAANLLGVHPQTLRHKMTKLGIPFGRKASSEY